MTTTHGILKVQGKGKSLQVHYTSRKNKPVQAAVSDEKLSQPLYEAKQQDLNSLDGTEVELILAQNGQPTQIWEVGQTWQDPFGDQAAKPSTQPQTRDLPRTKSSEPKASKDSTPAVEAVVGNFHNPYNFIPAPERTITDPDLGDHKPAGHGVYHPDRWSGRILVTLTTQTPLLVMDAAKAVEEENGHKTFPVRVGLDGKPYLPPTSIKGMLRSAYEAVTNSRLSIFEGHDERLAYRMPAKLGPIPARVEVENGSLVLRLMENRTIMGHAAKLPRYEEKGPPRDKGESRAALRYRGSAQKPQHGDHVWVLLNASKVTEILPWSADLPGGDWREGWVCVTGANISGKKYERVFVPSPNNRRIPVDDAIRALWQELIKNYQATHERDLKKRDDDDKPPEAYLGADPGETAWSRHVYTPEEAELREGTLCYVELNDDDEVQAVQPVTISRRLYEMAPDPLLPASLQPARQMQDLSPADRVFGWVNQRGKGSYKGNLRITEVQCCEDAAAAVTSFEGKEVPLAILGAPKPAQTRFYTAVNQAGDPLPHDCEKAMGYEDPERGLRGRKVYPHQNLPEHHWDQPWEDRTAEAHQGHYQEYRRPQKNHEEQRDDQNRSIRGWVNPGIRFQVTVDVTNLSTVELGALLWILDLPDQCYHRLGGGKPLGFGSVRLQVAEVYVSTGEGLRDYYASLTAKEMPRMAVNGCIDVFKQAVCRAYGSETFEQVPFIAAFCVAAQGFNDALPIHYPRTTAAPHPDGEAFKWFVNNEKTKGLKLSLSLLVEDPGLPLNPLSSET